MNDSAELLAAVRERHEQFDRQVSAWLGGYACLGGKIHCGRGCRNCCSLAVNTTFPEAAGIAGVLTGEQAERLAAHVALMRAHLAEAADMVSWLRLHRRKIGSCPFLDGEGACGVYAVRPVSCRALLATRESRWCGLDFAIATPEEKREFLDGLDRAVVAYPLHYVAATREWGEAAENAISRQMCDRYGFSISGSLPYLAWLEREHRLSAILPEGLSAVRKHLVNKGLHHPLLITLDR